MLPDRRVERSTGPQDLSEASNNSNVVAQLALTVSDPPTQGEVAAVMAKVNELIAALRR